MNLLRKLCFVFKHAEAIDRLVAQEEEAERERIREEKRHHLNLCTKHQQEQTRSHFSEHNCDYCKVEKERDNAQRKYDQLEKETREYRLKKKYRET